MRIVELNEGSMKNLLEEMLKRDPNNYESYTEAVQNIVDQVKERGDEAVFAFTKEFDKADVTAENVRVSQAEIEEAYKQVDKDLLAVMKRSMENIRAYHEKQKRNSWFDARPDGTILGQKVTALASAGVYVPGGKAAYPSSVLMNIIPAQTAGVERIVMVTPPGRDGRVNPVTLTAAPSGRRHGGIPGGRRPGSGCPGLRHPVDSPGGQDCGAGKYFRGPGKKGGLRPCEH